jgi:hypothetical protein
MIYFSNQITNFDNVPDDCEQIIFLNKIEQKLLNLPPICTKIVLIDCSLVQFRYLLKLPYNCSILFNKEMFFSENIEKHKSSDILFIINNFPQYSVFSYEKIPIVHMKNNCAAYFHIKMRVILI